MRKFVNTKHRVAAIVMWAAMGGTAVSPMSAAADRDGAQATSATQSAERARWEYCEIEFIRGTSPWFPASASSAGGDHVQWSSATASADGRSWRDLAGRMKITMPDKAASAKLVVFDALGALGWELVSATVPSGQAAPSSSWTFRRRAP